MPSPSTESCLRCPVRGCSLPPNCFIYECLITIITSPAGAQNHQIPRKTDARAP
jgi:hypothetical protein